MTEAINPELAALAAIDFEATDSAGPAAPGAEAQQASEAQATAQLDAAVAAVALGLLRTTRAVLVRKLPELRDEWSDDVLRMPADALPPVMKRYAGQISEWAARFPELMALGVACLPMLMGYMAAVEKHARTVTDVAPKQPAPQPQPAPAPSGPQPGPDGVFRVG